MPDASVAIKWFAPIEHEPHANKAFELLDAFETGGVELAAPELLMYEVAHTFARVQLDEAPSILADLRRMRFAHCSLSAEVLENALKLVRQYPVTIYDAVYHALALRTGGLLLTQTSAICKKPRRRARFVTSRTGPSRCSKTTAFSGPCAVSR